jgi:hypothetical protein
MATARKQADRKQTWAGLERALAQALPRLKHDQYLILDTPRGHPFVQFAGLGKIGMRAETVSNQYLAPKKKLDRRQHMRLLAMGWHPPTKLPPEFEDKRHRGGSPNFYLDCPRPVRWRAVARLALATLRRIHGITRPAKLRYDAFVHDGAPIEMPELGLARVRPPKESPAEPASVAPAPASERQAGPEHLLIAVSPTGEVTVEGPGDTLVARFHGSREQQLGYAFLLVRGHELLQAVDHALLFCQAVVEREHGRVQEAARSLIPRLQRSLEGFDPGIASLGDEDRPATPM